MEKTISWIILIWTIGIMPYVVEEALTFAEFFFGVLYLSLIIWLSIKNIRKPE